MSSTRVPWIATAAIGALALLAWLAGTGDLALTVVGLGAGLLGTKSALTTPHSSASSSTSILVVDVRHRDDNRFE